MIEEKTLSTSSKIRKILSDGKWRSIDDICAEYDEDTYYTRRKIRTAVVSMYGTGKLERKMIDNVGSVYRINDKGRSLADYPTTAPPTFTTMILNFV